jgi:membrane protease YdiL (CAAX protease family)
LGAREYQQLLRGPRFRWWRALLAVPLAALFAFALGLVLLFAASMVGMDDALLAEEMTPASFFYVNLLLASLIPVSMLATRIAHGAAAMGALSSVVGRLRWFWLWRCAVLISPVVLVYVVLSFLFDWPQEARPPDWALLLFLIVLGTPFQAAGEEYFFRGILLQNTGGLFADPKVALIASGTLTSVLFAAVHGSTDLWIFIDLLIFGSACTILAWRTGGLEAPIALHVVNNMVGMMFSAVTGGWSEGFVGPESKGSPLEPALTLIMCTTVVTMVLRDAKRRGIATSGGHPADEGTTRPAPAVATGS